MQLYRKKKKNKDVVDLELYEGKKNDSFGILVS
jgi:hypothetical protein